MRDCVEMLSNIILLFLLADNSITGLKLSQSATPVSLLTVINPLKAHRIILNKLLLKLPFSFIHGERR